MIKITLLIIIISSQLFAHEPGVKTHQNRTHFAQGLLIGVIDHTIREGIIFKGENFYFSMKAPTNNHNYWSFPPMRMQALDKNAYKKITAWEENKKVTIVSYIRHNPLHLLSRFAAWSHFLVNNVTQKITLFKNTLAYKKFGSKYQMSDERKKGRLNERDYKGYIVRTERWGAFGTGCNMYLLGEGTKTITTVTDSHADKKQALRAAHLLKTVTLIDDAGLRLKRENNEYKKKMELMDTVSHNKVKTHQVANLTAMTLHTENGCLYAEDILRARQLVKVNASTRIISVFSKRHTAHSIEVLFSQPLKAKKPAKTVK